MFNVKFQEQLKTSVFGAADKLCSIVQTVPVAEAPAPLQDLHFQDLPSSIQFRTQLIFMFHGMVATLLIAWLIYRIYWHIQFSRYAKANALPPSAHRERLWRYFAGITLIKRQIERDLGTLQDNSFAEKIARRLSYVVNTPIVRLVGEGGLPVQKLGFETAEEAVVWFCERIMGSLKEAGTAGAGKERKSEKDFVVWLDLQAAKGHDCPVEEKEMDKNI